MKFFENTRKPQGFGGKLMTKMMNSGHAKLSQWGFSNISAKSDAEVLDVGCGGGANIAVWLDRCRNANVLTYQEKSDRSLLYQTVFDFQNITQVRTANAHERDHPVLAGHFAPLRPTG